MATASRRGFYPMRACLLKQKFGSDTGDAHTEIEPEPAPARPDTNADIRGDGPDAKPMRFPELS